MWGTAALLLLRCSYYMLFRFIAMKDHISLLASWPIVYFSQGHRGGCDFSY